MCCFASHSPAAAASQLQLWRRLCMSQCSYAVLHWPSLLPLVALISAILRRVCLSENWSQMGRLKYVLLLHLPAGRPLWQASSRDATAYGAVYALVYLGAITFLVVPAVCGQAHTSIHSKCAVFRSFSVSSNCHRQKKFDARCDVCAELCHW